MADGNLADLAVAIGADMPSIDVREVECHCDPPCGWKHYKPVGEERPDAER